MIMRWSDLQKGDKVQIRKDWLIKHSGPEFASVFARKMKNKTLVIKDIHHSSYGGRYVKICLGNDGIFNIRKNDGSLMGYENFGVFFKIMELTNDNEVE